MNNEEKDRTWAKNARVLSDGRVLLFGKTKSTINEHIRNILKNELDETQVMRKFGKTELSSITTKPIYYYNLDMILAIGYRVNSKKGIEFRRWASNVLKQYLLKGYVINEERCLSCTSNIISLQNKVESIESKINNLENDIKKIKSLDINQDL